MKISIFRNGTYAEGVDYSYTPEDPETGTPEHGNPDCIGVFDVEYNPELEYIKVIDGEVVIRNFPTPEPITE